jgi:tetratricopeptide (TPR) repeat protein
MRRTIAAIAALVPALLLAGAAPDTDELEGPALLARAARSEAAGETAAALADLDTAVDWYIAQENTAGERVARVARGRWHGRHGTLADAVAELRIALPLADAGVDRLAPVALRLLLAELHLEQERAVEALAWTDAALIASAQPGGGALAGRACLIHLRTTAALDKSDSGLLGALQHIDRRLAEMADYPGPASLPGLLFAAAAEHLSAGDPPLAVTGLELTVRSADILGEPGQLPPFLTGLGYAALEADDLVRARAALERVLSLDDGRSVAALASLAEVERREGWLDEALSHIDEALELARADRESGEIGSLLGRRADLLAQLGRVDDARREWSRATRQLDDNGDRREGIRQQVRLAGAMGRERRWEEAEDHALRSLGRNRNALGYTGAQVSYADPGLAAEALLVMAAMHAARDRLDEARQALGQAATILDREGVVTGRDRVVAARVALALLAGDADAAEAALAALPTELADASILHHARASLALVQGDTTAAERHLRAALPSDSGLAAPEPWTVHPPLLPAAGASRDALIALLVDQGRGRELVEQQLTEGWIVGAPVSVPWSSEAGPDADVPVLGVILTRDGGWTVLVSVEQSSIVPLELTREQLEDAVRVLADLPADGARARQLENWRAAGKLLHDALIGPHEARLAELDSARLVLALDPALAALPGAALWDGDAHLVERFVLSRAPAGGRRAPPYEGKPRLREAEVVDLLPSGPSAAIQLLRDRVRTTVTREELASLSHPADTPAPVLHLACAVRVHPLEPARSRMSLWGDDEADAAAVAGWPPRRRWTALETPAEPGVAVATRALAGALVAGGSPHVLLLPTGGERASLYKALLKASDRQPLPGALARAQRGLIAAGAPAEEWAGVSVVGW